MVTFEMSCYINCLQHRFFSRSHFTIPTTKSCSFTWQIAGLYLTVWCIIATGVLCVKLVQGRAYLACYSGHSVPRIMTADLALKPASWHWPRFANIQQSLRLDSCQPIECRLSGHHHINWLCVVEQYCNWVRKQDYIISLSPVSGATLWFGISG